MFNLEDVIFVADALSIKFDKFTPFDLQKGMNIETNNGNTFKHTTITNNDLIITAQKVITNLNKNSNYYNKINSQTKK